MNKNTLITSLVLCFIASSCTLYHVQSEDISTDYYPSKKSINDVAYIENLDQPHEIIAVVTVNAERRQYLSEVIERLKREAGIIGADAITSIQTDSTGEWKKLPAQKTINNAYVRANFSASAIKLK